MPQEIRNPGKDPLDPGLYPWALGALSRALVFYGQARASIRNKALAAIAAYYSLLHLSLFIGFQNFASLPENVRKKINDRLQRGEDPARGPSHGDVEQTLASFVRDHGMPAKILEVFKAAKKLREFHNYGPRVTYTPSKGPVRFVSCEYNSGDVDRVVRALQSCFEAAVTWLVSLGELQPGVLRKAEDIVRPASGFYRGLIPRKVLDFADGLRVQLYTRISDEPLDVVGKRSSARSRGNRARRSTGRPKRPVGERGR